MIDQHSSLGEKFLKKWLWLYIFSFIIAPIWYIIKILIAGEVSVSELGTLYWVISLITLLSAFSDLWIGESLKYFIPQYNEQKQYSKIKSILVYSFCIQIIAWFLLMVLFFLGADFLGEHYFKNEYASAVIKVFSLFFLGINIFQIITQFFLAVQDTLYYKLSEFVRNICIVISTIALIYFDASQIYYFSFSWIIGVYIAMIFALIIFFKKYYVGYLRSEKIIWSKKLACRLFSYSFIVFLSAQAAVILSQVDIQMIIYILWTQDTWYYSVYLSLIMIPFLVIGPIFLVLMPIFAELKAKQSIDKIIFIKSLFAQYFIAIAIFFSLFLFVFAEHIAYILFWESFLKSAEILKYSCLFLVFNFLFQINFNILGGIWKVKERFKITSIALIINTLLNIVLIQYIWVAWAALATAIWWLCIWLMSEYSLGKTYIQIPNPTFIIKNIVFMTFLWAISTYFIMPYFSFSSRLESLFLILWIGLLWLLYFGFINLSQAKYFIWEVKKLKKWKK